MASAIPTRTDSNGRIDDKARALLQQRAVVHRNPASTPNAAPQIEEWEVEHALRQMKPGKAPGPDRISVDFLKSASRTVIKQLTRRYNRYMDAQEIPDQWKTSSTVLLFKKGERDLMKTSAHCPLLADI
ncbi:hypothetical protein COOONC_26896 [Cooperia oncophora]